MPGSRLGEVMRHFPVMIKAAEIIKLKMNNVKFVVGCASKKIYEYIRDIRNEYNVKFEIGDRVTYDILNVADFALTSSGTATLEACCFGVPMVVIYKMHPLNYMIVKRLVNVKHIAMVNIIAGKRLVPELIQKMAHPQNISQKTIDMISDDKKIKSLKEKLLGVASELGESGACRRAAESIINIAKIK